MELSLWILIVFSVLIFFVLPAIGFSVLAILHNVDMVCDSIMNAEKSVLRILPTTWIPIDTATVHILQSNDNHIEELLANRVWHFLVQRPGFTRKDRMRLIKEVLLTGMDGELVEISIRPKLYLIPSGMSLVEIERYRRSMENDQTGDQSSMIKYIRVKPEDRGRRRKLQVELKANPA